MKKIYSFVLMAAALLVGTNVKAVTVETDAQFYAAWEQSGDVTIDLDEDIELAKTLWLGTVNESDAARKVVINLNGYELTLSAGFLLTHGTLEINGKPGEKLGNGGSKISGNNCANEIFFVTGARTPSYENFTNLKIGEGVWVNYDTYLAAISIDRVPTSGRAYSALASGVCSPAKSQLNYNTDIYTGSGAAFGVNVEVAGKISATRYTVKSNGNLGYEEATKDKTPFIHICSTADLYVPASSTNADKKPLAIYASGYARWLIEGKVQGNVGVAVKSGQVDINGANISSNNTANYTPANESKSGSKAEGCAVVISSEKAYAGEIDVTIGANATLTAGKGYALDESVATPTEGSKVDAISIEGATFNAGTTSAGAITISETTSEAAANPADPATIVVTSAKVTGSITIGDPEQGMADLDDFTSTSAVLQPTDPQNPNQGATTIVPLDIQLTSDGYASFSAPINLFKATGKDEYKAFGIYTGILTGDVLELNEVGYVKKNEGVILHCSGETKNIKCYFTTTGDPDNFNTPQYPNNSIYANHLNASADWVNQTNKSSIYCLRNVGIGTMLYQYTGDYMPDNKAYLDMSQFGSSAPQRIRMVIAQEEQTEAIESVEAASVKAVKFVENGEILIRRGENVYNLQGQIVK